MPIYTDDVLPAFECYSRMSFILPALSLSACGTRLGLRNLWTRVSPPPAKCLRWQTKRWWWWWNVLLKDGLVKYLNLISDSSKGERSYSPASQWLPHWWSLVFFVVGFPNWHKSLGWGIRLYSPSSSLFPFSSSNSNKYPHFPFTCSLIRLKSVHQFSSWCSSSLLRLEQVQPKNSGKNSLSWKWLLRRGQRPRVSPCRQSQEEGKAETCSHIFQWEFWGRISVRGFTWPEEGKTRAVGFSWRSWRRCCWRWILHPARLSFWTQVFTFGFCNDRNNTWHLRRVQCDQDGWKVQEDLRKESVTTFHKVLVTSNQSWKTLLF